MRKSIIAALLTAWLLPFGVAFSQIPPPVPALPDAERRTQYTIAGTTCACSVGFALYGDGTDYGNWIEVWLNGVLQPSSSYTVTSATGTLATIPRPITNAVLTFNVQQTGTVQIVGARRPRRASQFQENAGVSARNLNQVITDLTAQNRETWDRGNDITGRTIRTPPGETFPTLPGAASRAGGVLAFDGSGNGVVQPNVPAGSIPVNSITNALLAQMPANTFKCNNTSSTANASDACSLSGVDASVLNVQTANYSIATSDCGKVIQAGTGSTGLFTLTLPVVGAFPSNCVVSVKNGDTTRGKVLVGFPSDLGRGSILWPLQFGQVRIINGAWASAINPGFWAPSTLTLQVNHVSGSDAGTNDCLGTGAGACATITRAVTILQNYVSCQNFQPIVQNAQETFTEQVSIVGPACGFGASNCVIIQGTPGAPANTVWTAPGGMTYGLFLNDYACAIPNGFKMASAATGQIAMYAGKYSDLAYMNIEFGAFAGAASAHLVATFGHIVYEGGTYVVSGNVGFHWQAVNGGRIEVQTPTISVPNALTFTDWAALNSGGILYFNGAFSGTGSGAGSTGTKYNATYNSVAVLNGATLPGASAGTTSTGGQVSP